MDPWHYSIAEMMQQSGVTFGTSGARGLVNALSDKVAYSYTTAFLQYLFESDLVKVDGYVAVAGDLRPSTPQIMTAVCKAIQDKGQKVINCGFVPSPAVALYGLRRNMPSIMVTGSHIPDDRNGIKFNRPDGEILKEDEEAIRAQRVSLPEELFDQAGVFVKNWEPPQIDLKAYYTYVKRYTDFFEEGCLQGMKVGLYEHSSVARESLCDVLKALGAKVVSLGFSDDFVPVDTEAIRPEDVQLAEKWARLHELDTIVSTDGDGDRPLISDEQGRWLRGDVAGMLCAGYLNAQWIATPVSSNTAVDRSGWFDGVLRTRIGSPYVISAMHSLLQDGKQGVVGYEANGGFLHGDSLSLQGRALDPLPTRDAMIVILSILNLAQAEQKRISELLVSVPARYTYSNRLKSFPQELSKKKLECFQSGDFERDSRAIELAFDNRFGSVKDIDLTDGVRITFAGDDVVHLRPSGNAPELRCYTEADSEHWVREMNQICINLLEGWRVH
jgi:phosphomannomutase